jgi:hypothetical protein
MSTARHSAEIPYVDAHVHIRAASARVDIAKASVGAVRDAGTREGFGLGLRSERNGERPVIITAGRALVKTGGYGSNLGSPVEGRADIERAITGLAEAGAGVLKVVASGVVSLQRAGEVTPGGFDRGELRFIVETAGRHGLAVMAHANGAEVISDAAEAGVRSIEHGYFMTRDALAVMKANSVFWVPTVGALQRAAEFAGASDATRTIVAGTIDRHLEMVNAAFQLGVHLAIGTDCVLPDRRYGGCYQAELIYFRKAGIPNEEVERIAREGGRELLGLV